MKRAAVTGASGFIGSRLCPMLEAAGWEVERIGRFLPNWTQQHRPNVVFHIAGLFVSQHDPGDVDPLIESNLRFGAQILECMAQAGVKRLVTAGSFWQHPRPRNLYAATKTAFEAIAGYYHDAHGIQVVTVTLPDVYGPGDPRQKLVNVLRNANGERIPMLPANHMIDLVHVDDVCRAFIAAAELSAGTWSVSAGPVRLETVVHEFERCHGHPLNVGWGERMYRPREMTAPWVGAIVPGWEPKIGLREGIAGLFHP